MTTKPGTLPEWATDGGADVVEPTTLEKQTGWILSQKPPAQWFNWWQLLVFRWVQWLNAFESEIHTWSAAQTFEDDVAINANLTLVGDGTFTGVQRFPNGLVISDAILGDGADAAPLMRTNTGPATENFRLLTEYAPYSVGGKLRTYIGIDANTYTTLNALWNQGALKWDVDDITSPSRRVTVGRLNTLIIERYTAGGVNFANAAWVVEFKTYTAGGAADPGVLDDDGVGIITRKEFKRYSSSGSGTALTRSANVDDTVTTDYTRNFLGETVLSGTLTANTTITSGTQIASLPVGYRPKRTTYRPILSNFTGQNNTWLRLQTNGRIDLMADGWSPAAGFSIDLDGIRFDADF